MQSVRDELERVPICGPSSTAVAVSTALPGSQTAPPAVDANKLQAEIQSLRRQLHALQHTQQSKSTSQKEDAAVLEAQVEAHRRVAVAARSDHDHNRSALLAAEMDLQRSKETIATLKVKLETQELHIQEQSRQLNAAQKEVERTKQEAAAAVHHAESLNKDKTEALGIAGEATAEAGRLEVECTQKDGELEAARRAVAQAHAAAAASDARATTAEAALAFERTKRGALEGEIARMQSENVTLDASIADVHRRSKADVAAWEAQLEALQEELGCAQKAERVVRREAEAFRVQIDGLTRAHASAVAAAKSAQEKLLGAEAEAEAALRRALHAENQVSVAAAAAAEHNTEAEKEATLRYETEVRALKEVLDRVATAAQQKDSALNSAQNDVAMLRAECAALEASCRAAQQQLAETQAAAAAEFSNYDAQVKAAYDAVEAAQSAAAAGAAEPLVKLNISVQEELSWSTGDPIPLPLQRHFDAQAEQLVSAAVKNAVAAECRGHAAAVRALEAAHIAGMEARSAADGEELHALREQCSQTAVRLHAAEGELLVAQDQAARLNSAVTKLEKKVESLKKEIADAAVVKEEEYKKFKNSPNDDVDEGEFEMMRRRVKESEAAAQLAQAELADAQDEVEALLTARLTQLSSRPVSEAGDPPLEDNSMITAYNNNNDNNRQTTQPAVVAPAMYNGYNNDNNNNTQEERFTGASRPTAQPAAVASIANDDSCSDSEGGGWREDDDDLESDEEDLLRQMSVTGGGPLGAHASSSHFRGPLDFTSHGHHHEKYHSIRNSNNEDVAENELIQQREEHSWVGTEEAQSIQAMREEQQSFAASGSVRGGDGEMYYTVAEEQQQQVAEEEYEYRRRQNASGSGAPVGRQSPLKKLANMLRGKKARRRDHDDVLYENN